MALQPALPCRMKHRRLCGRRAPGAGGASGRSARALAAGGTSGSSRGFGLLEWAGSLVPQGPLVTGTKQAWNIAFTTLVRELAPQTSDGAYARPGSAFSAEHLTSLDPSRQYVAYVGPPCPWCHRVELAASLLALDSSNLLIQQLQSDAERASRGGWVLPSPSGDAVFGRPDMRGVYDAAVGGFGYTGRATAPLLVDRQSRSIVCNDSGRIVQLLQALAQQTRGADAPQLVPESIAHDINALSERIYENINNGVYKCGFATSSSAYEQAEEALFSTLAELNERLSTSRFLHGNFITLSDLWLLPTAAYATHQMRFDNVYHVLFRCARHTLASHEHLHGWLRDMTSILGMKTIRIQDWRHGYYQQLFPLNPSQIVPRGPSAEELGLGKQDEERLRALDVNSSDDVFFRKRHEQVPVS